MGLLIVLSLAVSMLLPASLAIFPFGPAFVFQTSSRPPAQNNTAGSFTSNISFDAITNVSNVVVAVSQTMGRSLDTTDLDTSEFGDNRWRPRVNSSVFLFKDGNWTSYRLRKRRSTTFDLAKQITNQVFAAVNTFMNQTANQTTFDLVDRLLNASAQASNRSRRALPKFPPGGQDAFTGVQLFDENSQELLDDLESLSSFSRIQRAMLVAISKNLRTVRASSWRVLVDEFKTFNSVPTQGLDSMRRIFNRAVERFSADSDGKCWPTEATMAPLSSLFRASADAMAQCYGRVFVDSRSLLDSIRANFSTPLSLPMELFQQFNYCDSLNGENDDLAALTQSLCMAKIPLLVETSSLNSQLGYNRIREEGQQMLIMARGNLLQCTLTELNSLQSRSEDWNLAYGQCLAGEEMTTTSESSSTSSA